MGKSLQILSMGWLFLVQLGWPQSREIRLIAGGDLMIGSWVIDVVRREGMDYPFHQIRSLLKGADVVFANLEAPFTTEGQPFPKQYTFKVPPDLVGVLQAGGINLVSLANNHIMDYGETGLRHTLAVLDEKGIYYAGAGMNLQQARQPAVLTIGERTIGFLAYSLTFPQEFWPPTPQRAPVFPIINLFTRMSAN